MSKTVLMITYPYYPANASGVHRSVANAKYLPSFGWTPIVLCRRRTSKNSPATYDPQLANVPDICNVIRIDIFQNRLTQKIETLFWKIFGGGSYDYRNPYVLYFKMLRAADKIIKNNKIDIIWSTFTPGLDHRVASHLCKKYTIPWIADFRDLPDQSYDTLNTRHVVRQEIATCASAKALVATTDELAEKLRTRHKSPVYTIFNGFEPDDFEFEPPMEDFGNKFTINHFGVLYKFRDPSSLFAAIDLLVGAGKMELKKIEINFYGAHSKTVENFAKNYNCASCVKAPGRLPYKDMLFYQKTSQILLLVASRGQGGAIPAKLYGYLASKRPILCVPGDGAGSDRIISQTQTGVSLSDPEEISNWLAIAYDQWEKDGFVGFSCNETEVQKYSRKTQAGQLANIFEKIVF